jgi:hypothetical protein
MAIAAVCESFAAATESRRPDTCQPAGPALARARRDWQRVDATISGLRDDSDVRAANQALVSLLASPCFAAREESTRDLPAKSALSLRTFWESGGRAWVRSCLQRQTAPTRIKDVVVPPDVRPSLSAESPPADLPAELLCPVGDATCSETTRGWVEQAERYFRQLAQLGRTPTPRLMDGRALSETCRQAARRRPNAERYFEWRTCLESNRPYVPALPLASYRAPSIGWLVVRGAREGDGEFCRELHAYHLETGAAQIARTCTKDVRTASGIRDPQASEATRRLVVTAGALDLDPLRRLLWMAVLNGRVAPAQVEALRCPLPVGLVPRWPRGASFEQGPGWVLGGATHTTELHWRWIGSRALASGALTWPPLYHGPADDYTGQLLKAAEATLVPGCPPACVPAAVLEVGQDDDPIEAAYDAQLRAALLQPPPACDHTESSEASR